MNNFKNSEAKNNFNRILKEFLGALVSLGVLTIMIYIFGGFYKSTNTGIRCNAEKVVSWNRKNYLWDRDRRFGGGDLQSSEVAHSGQHSVKLDKDHKYGLSYNITNADGDEDLWISVWRYNPDQKKNKGKLVCSAGSYVISSDEVKERQDSGWEKLFIRAFIPINSKNEKIKIFCTHEGEEPTFFDDLFIDFRRTDK